VLALMEIEQKQNPAAKLQILEALKNNPPSEITLLLSAAYLQRSTEQVAALI